MKTPVILLSSLTASSVLLLAQVPDPAAIPAPAESVREEVGISANDGITVSGQDILVTRNGVSERLTKEMRLANGTRVLPDGSITLSDGTRVSLKASQVLSFAGVVRTVPERAAGTARPAAREIVVQVVPASATDLPADASRTTAASAATVRDGVAVYSGLPYLIRNGRASVIDSKLIPEGQILTMDGHYIPITFTFKDLPPNPVQKGTDQQTRIGEPGTPQTRK